MNYPFELRIREANAIAHRRKKALSNAGANPLTSGDLPPDTIGLALSGGGIRSATVCLGVLQTLAKRDLLRKVDFLSTVSGGGYIGSFLGRSFLRKSAKDSSDAGDRVRKMLSDCQSPQIEWLRSYGNYILHNNSDLVEELAVFWRNLLTIYLVLFSLAGTLFGLLRISGYHLGKFLKSEDLSVGPFFNDTFQISPWWPLPVAVLFLGVIPCMLGYWLIPSSRSKAPIDFMGAIAWLALLTAFSVGFSLTPIPYFCGAAILVLLMSAVWLEAAHWQVRPKLDQSALKPEISPGTMMRNWITQTLGQNITLFAGCVIWVLVDSLAMTVATGKLLKLIAYWSAALMPVLPFLQRLAKVLSGTSKHQKGKGEEGASPGWHPSATVIAGIVAFPLVLLLIVLLDASIHWSFIHHPSIGFALVSITTMLSLLLGRAFHFLNYCSLQQTYAARICRTFLGASNPARFRSTATQGGRDISTVDPDDDIKFEDYHPEQAGGPLHLINICINETVDGASQRQVPDSKGLPLCVGPCGVSVGRNYHSYWCPPPAKPLLKTRIRRALEQSQGTHDENTALQAITRGGQLFHVLKGKSSAPITVERLSLSTWIAISGAAVGTGRGRQTEPSLGLLLGLANLRLGYWWDSGLSSYQRPGCFPASLWQKVKNLPGILLPMQSLLLSEFRARFGGPKERLWALSDGGFFDNTGMYELFRRRVPLIIAVDAGADPDYTFEDLGLLVAKVRMDFGAAIEFVNAPTNDLIDVHKVPLWIATLINAGSLGNVNDIGKRNHCCAALGRATYTDSNAVTWIIYIKESLNGDQTVDVSAYQRTNPAFPNEPTTDQFFTESQWESYRALGEQMAAAVFK
jgi:hypothetical protein